MSDPNNNQMAILDSFGPVADAFKDVHVDNSAWTAGIGMAWPILTIKGKSWGWRFRGESRVYDAPNAAAGGAIMPVQFLDVVLVKPGTRISKVYYKSGFVDGQRTPPDCWSADGVTPDDGAPDKQSKNCRGCQWNVFGSRIGDAGQKGKACSDNKRIAVVTLGDLANTDFGGPFMLRLPPGSFSNYTTYVSVMGSRGYAPHTVVTRMMFDPSVAHPRILFMPVRPVNGQEAPIVIRHLNNPRTDEMLNDKAVAAFADAGDDMAVEDLPTSPTQPGPASAPNPTPTPSPTPAAAAGGAGGQEPPKDPPLTPEQQEIARLKAQLAQANAPEPEPEPVLTPEQMEIAALKAKLAEAEAAKAKPRRTRTTPVKPGGGPSTVTPTSNGATNEGHTPDPIGNNISDRIAKMAGQAAKS